MTCRRVRVNVKSVTCDSLLRETYHTITAVGWGCSSIFNFLPNQVNKRNQKDDAVNHKLCFDVDLKRPNYKVAEAVKNALKIVQIYFDKLSRQDGSWCARPSAKLGQQRVDTQCGCALLQTVFGGPQESCPVNQCLKRCLA